MPPAPVIFGLAGPTLSDWERHFFRDCDPLGFILFSRNIETPAQVSALCQDLRGLLKRADAPILIDQEGGRVARLRPPHWRAAPAAAVFGAHFRRAPDEALEAVQLNARLLAWELSSLGIDVDCAPVCDLSYPGADKVIGDRAYGEAVDAVVALARAACEGFLAGGVLPVVKHAPGHGRAMVDSHNELPVVDTDLATLMKTDFAVFRGLADAPWAMTAHVVFTVLDADAPATTSRIVIEEAIRRQIGFNGVLVSDDLSMQALSGDLSQRTSAALSAGCDLALHCNGAREEMLAVARALPPMPEICLQRLSNASARRHAPHDTFDPDEARARLADLLPAA